LNQIIANFWNRVTKELQAELDKPKRRGKFTYDSNASGRLRQSIQPLETTRTPTSLTMRLGMEDYAEYVDAGRRRGKRPPVSAIEQWLIDKGIQTRTTKKENVNVARRNKAQAIANAIGRRGIKGTKFIRNVWNQQLLDGISDELATKLGNRIFSIEIK
jgi:hypothetical protein